MKQGKEKVLERPLEFFAQLCFMILETTTDLARLLGEAAGWACSVKPRERCCPVSAAFILRNPGKAGSATRARSNAEAKLNLSKLAISSFELMFSKWKSCEALG